MKSLFALTLFSILLYCGCDQQSDITAPVDISNSIEIQPEIPDSVEVIPWPYPPGADTIFFSVGLPESEIPNLIVSDVVVGNEGGQLLLDYEYTTNDGDTISILAELGIPYGAFDGVKEISMKFSHEIASVSFYPHIVFDIPVELKIIFTGIDLSGLDPDSVDFIFQNHDGTTENVKYNLLSIDIVTGTIAAGGIVLTHFSRYGFVN